MTSFSQLGDPVCAACLCEHHGAAYVERQPSVDVTTISVYYDLISNGATIVQMPITITKTSCVVVNAATNLTESGGASDLEIERPLGTIKTQQEDTVLSNELYLLHHAAWEVLDPGTYTYFLVNRSGGTAAILAAWLKIIASDCEG